LHLSSIVVSKSLEDRLIIGVSFQKSEGTPMVLPNEKLLYTVEQYLQMERASEERHEYIDGYVYDMAGESPDQRKPSHDSQSSATRETL
jgi:hypothetical protein